MTSRLGSVIEVVGRFVSASNATLLGRSESGELVVYKPIAGERPLWDFPEDSLAVREVLTFEIDRTLEFGVVPETALADGPFGPGSIQRYVEPDERYDPLPSIRRGTADLWPVAVLDVVCNNADRKAGHLIREKGTGQLFGIDHGLTFHPDDKLRTVLWAFAGRPVPAELVGALLRLRAAIDDHLGERFTSELGEAETVAMTRRVDELLAGPVHPLPPDDRPALPWPPV